MIDDQGIHSGLPDYGDSSYQALANIFTAEFLKSFEAPEVQMGMMGITPYEVPSTPPEPFKLTLDSIKETLKKIQDQEYIVTYLQYVPDVPDWVFNKGLEASGLGFGGTEVLGAIEKMCPEAMRAWEAHCPEGCRGSFLGQRRLVDAIVHLNDTHKWTREQIADWVDGLNQDFVVNRPASLGD